MRVQTNAGEIELTAEMVRPGMVFENRHGGRVTYVSDMSGAFASEWTDGVYVAFLGCDPAVAFREDCERYGIAPGIEAWVRGFARLPTGGALDLAKPDNVRKGMLFRAKTAGGEYRDIVAVCDGNFGVPASAGRFLGCHPDIARREDCERFGIPERCEHSGVPDVPIDAAAHGFARLRDGGAVDLRREAPSASVYTFIDGHATRYTTGASVSFTENMRFIGLDARHARPEDVARLCCGERQGGWHWPLATNVRDLVPPPRCTLTLGHNGEHEDLATGARWGEGAEMYDRVKGSTLGKVDVVRGCPGCGATNGAMCADACPALQRHREQWEATHCGARAKPGQRLTSERGEHQPAHGDERCTNGKDCNGQHGMAFRGPRGTLWTDDAPLSVDAAASAASCEGCGALDAPCSEGCSKRRRATEAPLVALVAAVPPWANPTGWRAAVLAVNEMCVRRKGHEPLDRIENVWKGAECELAIRIVALLGVAADAYSDTEQVAVDAYLRAIAPQGPRPEPFRRKAPGLPVDDGRDA